MHNVTHHGIVRVERDVIPHERQGRGLDVELATCVAEEREGVGNRESFQRVFIEGVGFCGDDCAGVFEDWAGGRVECLFGVGLVFD